MARIIKAHGSSGDQRAAVLKLADFAAEARALVLEARKEAARIVGDARGKVEDGERQAGEKGYAEGFARGQEEGYAEGQKRAMAQAREELAAESGDLLPLARKAVDEIAQARTQLGESDRREVIELAVRIAERIVGRVASANIDAACENLAKALELAKRSGEITVAVNPDQLDRLRRHCPRLAESLGFGGRIQWVPGERIGPGGVKIRSRRGQIDATIETQLANVAEALLGPAGGDGEGESDRRGADGAGDSGVYVPQSGGRTETSRTKASAGQWARTDGHNQPVGS